MENLIHNKVNLYLQVPKSIKNSINNIEKTLLKSAIKNTIICQRIYNIKRGKLQYQKCKRGRGKKGIWFLCVIEVTLLLV